MPSHNRRIRAISRAGQGRIDLQPQLFQRASCVILRWDRTPSSRCCRSCDDCAGRARRRVGAIALALVGSSVFASTGNVRTFSPRTREDRAFSTELLPSITHTRERIRLTLHSPRVPRVGARSPRPEPTKWRRGVSWITPDIVRTPTSAATIEAHSSRSSTRARLPVQTELAHSVPRVPITPPAVGGREVSGKLGACRASRRQDQLIDRGGFADISRDPAVAAWQCVAQCHARYEPHGEFHSRHSLTSPRPAMSSDRAANSRSIIVIRAGVSQAFALEGFALFT